jgi:heat shock protein HslJ
VAAKQADDQPLTGVEWALRAVVRDGGTVMVVPDEVDAVLRMDGAGGLSGCNGCNYLNGANVGIGATTLDIEDGWQTQMRCSGVRAEVERLVDSVLFGRISWMVRGDELRIWKPDGPVLVFTPRESIYPHRDLTPLLQGQRDGGDYRFGWGANAERAWLVWEWRDGPGKAWGVASQAQDKSWTGPRPEPLDAWAGTARFVFGFVTAAAARAALQPAGGGAAVPLQLFTIPDAGNLQAVGGFVTDPIRGSAVITYRPDGTELTRSIDL